MDAEREKTQYEFPRGFAGRITLMFMNRGHKSIYDIVCDGCIVSGGTVWNSILSPGVIVERDAAVEQSVIFDDVIIEPGVRMRRAIVDKGSRIRAGTSIGYDRETDKRRGCTISDNGIVVVPKGTDISRTEPSLF